MNVHFALLALLAGEPRSGGWLREELTAGHRGVDQLNVHQVHLALTRLQRAGLVESGAGAGSPRQEFRITTHGQRELAGWLRTTPAPGALPGDELVRKIQLAAQVPGTDVREVIQAHRRYLMELMQRRTRARQEGVGQNLGRALASYAELFWLDSAIRWLDAAEGLLAPGRPGVPEQSPRLTRSGPRTPIGRMPWPASAITSSRAARGRNWMSGSPRR